MLGSKGFAPDGTPAPVDPPAAPAAAAPPASVPPVTPGESPSAAPAGESAAPSEGAGTKPQGATPAGQEDKGQDPVVTPPAAEPPNPAKQARHNFEAKRVRLEKQIDQLQTDLDLERGSKAKLSKQLEDLQAELAKLKPAEAPAAVTPPALVRPKRPTLSDVDFDQERLEAALDEHEAKLDEYNKAVIKQETEAAQQKAAREREEREQREAATLEERQYQQRMAEGRAEISDWDEVMETTEDLEASDVTTRFINVSEIPAHLIHHLLQNSDDLNRIEKLDPVRRVRALTALELQLADKRKARTAAPPVDPAPVTPPVAATPPPTPPAQPPAPTISRPAKVDEPITPVGSRAPAVGQRLSQAATPKDYLRMRLIDKVNQV